MIAAGFERCVSMIMFRMIVHCPRGTACQREQKEPDCEQASDNALSTCSRIQQQHIAISLQSQETERQRQPLTNSV